MFGVLSIAGAGLPQEVKGRCKWDWQVNCKGRRLGTQACIRSVRPCHFAYVWLKCDHQSACFDWMVKVVEKIDLDHLVPQKHPHGQWLLLWLVIDTWVSVTLAWQMWSRINYSKKAWFSHRWVEYRDNFFSGCEQHKGCSGNLQITWSQAYSDGQFLQLCMKAKLYVSALHDRLSAQYLTSRLERCFLKHPRKDSICLKQRDKLATGMFVLLDLL